jgi:hypothetical protein
MKSYVIEVKTAVDMGSEQFATSFLHDWFNQLPPRLHPNRYDKGEPVRKSLQPENLETATKAWSDLKFPILLKRTTKPRFQTSGSASSKKGINNRLFPGEYTVWLDTNAGDELALLLFRFLINHCNPAFGAIACYEDKRNKHFVTYRETYPGGGSAQVEQYVGLGVGETLPGIYWATYFGPWALGKIGREKVLGLKVPNIESIGDGLMILAYDELSEIDPVKAHAVEDQIVQSLGKANFFDKSKWRPPNKK